MFKDFNEMFVFLYEKASKSLVLVLIFIEIIIKCLKIFLNNVFKKIRVLFKSIQNFFKTYCFVSIKTICFVILVLSGLSVTLDYLSYPYIYKLIVSDNKYGFDLPAISVCTERHVFFDKHKVIQYFDLQQKYDEWKGNVSQVFQNEKLKCNRLMVFPSHSRNRNYWPCTLLEAEQNHNLSKFFRDYERMIFESLSFDQMKNLTISANELFKCSAKLHFRYEAIDTNSTVIPNCFQRFDVLESIYGNDFGICYTFFAKNYSIYLKDDDYIQFDIKYETQKNFIISGFYNRSQLPSSKNEKDITDLEPDSDDYFGLYFSVNQKHREMFANFETSFKSMQNSLNSELRFRKTSIELLSTPYMQECKQYGKS